MSKEGWRSSWRAVVSVETADKIAHDLEGTCMKD